MAVPSSAVFEAVEPQLISRIADTTGQRDREALYDSVLDMMMEFLDARAARLFRVVESPEGARLLLRACRPAATAEVGELPLLSADPLRQGCYERRNWVCGTRDDAPRVYLFPVEDRGSVVAMLELVIDLELQKREVTLVRALLRILKNQLALLDYGERDTLTGLLNRKTLESQFHKIASTTASRSGASWLGMLDIDHFKTINDRYGHLFGDEVLLRVSQIMKRTFRGTDRLFRFGGEEFVVILENSEPAGAAIAFNRLREAVEVHAFPQALRVTVSLGYTRIAEGDVPMTCIERADAALYSAKRRGRNNVQHDEALVVAAQDSR